MKRKLLYKLFPICLALLLAVGSPVYAQPAGEGPSSQDIFIQTEAAGDPAAKIPEIPEVPETPDITENTEIPDAMESDSQEEADTAISDGPPSDVSGEILDAADVDKLQRMLADEGYIGIAPMSVEYISNFAQLENALNDPAVTVAVIMGDIEMERTLTIDRDLIFLAVADAVLISPPEQYARHFFVSSPTNDIITIDFNRIILDGSNVSGGISGGASMTLKGAVIQNCYGYVGGAIGFEPGNLWIENCTITGNTSEYNGGGIYNSPESLTVVNSTIKSNKCQNGFGGGIYCDGGELTLDNSTVTDNYSGQYGGGVATYFLTMIDTEITGNIAEENGGGIAYRGGRAYSNPEISMGDSIIADNKANCGGGIYFNPPFEADSTTRLTKGTISNNTAAYGGGIYAESTSYPSLRLALRDISLTENQASVSGGAISFNYGDLDIDYTIISQNHAEENGGGIYLPNGDLHLSNTDILSNSAGIDGGGIYTFIDSTYWLEVKKSNISDNQAQNGGGIAVRAEAPGITGDYEFHVADSVISGNLASDKGGGILYEGGSHLSIWNAKVISNTASSGGGIWLADLSRLSASSEVIFAGNKADEGYIMTDPVDIATHELCIKTTHFSDPFTLYAYNNYDVNYTKGELLVPLTVNYYIRSTDTTPYATAYVYANKALETGDLPDDPSQYGLIFLGWTDENSVFYYPDTVITEDTELYACWRLL